MNADTISLKVRAANFNFNSAYEKFIEKETSKLEAELKSIIELLNDPSFTEQEVKSMTRAIQLEMEYNAQRIRSLK